MWNQFSDQAISMLQGHHRVLAIAVEVRNSRGVFLKDITYALTGGSISEDETSEIRRTVTMTLNDPTLLPVNSTDLLHPLSGNEIHVFKGCVPQVEVGVATGPELAPMGVFRLTTPEIDDDGGAVQVTFNGNDRSVAISQAMWTAPYTAAAGVNLGAAIMAILNDRWPGPVPLKFNFAPTSVVVPIGTVLGISFTSSGATVEVGSSGGNNDPWADCQQLASEAGMLLYFDRQGVVTLAPVLSANAQQVQMTFVEGTLCPVLTGRRVLDETNFANAVYVIGTGTVVTNTDGSTSPGAPVVGYAYSADPTYGVTGIYGEQPVFITNPTVATVDDANMSAQAELVLSMSVLDTTSFTAVDDPRLDCGDLIEYRRERMGINNVGYVPTTITHPLDVTSPMEITNRGYAVALP